MTLNHHRRIVPALLLLAAATVVPSAGATTGSTLAHSANPVTIAVIGDVPYGVAQEAQFHHLVDAINEDPKVRTTIHVGDFKSGSTTCSDARFAAAASAFATFEDPFVYTPGDNEWTDCHRPNNGSYHPHERLAAVRSTFFSEPGDALGMRPMAVDAQAGFPENVRWQQSRIVFATLHVIGSDNGLGPWTGLGHTEPTPAQLAEVGARIDATVAWVDAAFDRAEADQGLGVVLAMQADTWNPMPTTGQRAIVDRIAARSAAFAGQVLVFQGDTHKYLVDRPLALGNVTRIVVHGETLPFEYLRLTVDPRAEQLFSWERVPVAAG